MEITIGIQKEITLPTLESGNYLRTGDVGMEYNQMRPDGYETEKTAKVEMLLFKSIEAYQSGAQPLAYRAVYRVNYTLKELYESTEPMPEILWNKLLSLPELQDANRLKITV